MQKDEHLNIHKKHIYVVYDRSKPFKVDTNISNQAGHKTFRLTIFNPMT